MPELRAITPASVVKGQERFLSFRVDGKLYALPASVAEVIHLPVYARVPHAPAALLGIGNLRGAILPVVGLRVLLGLAEIATGMAIVLDTGAPVALVVDAVEALVSAADIKTAAAELGAAKGEVLLGAFQTAGGVAKILDIQTLLSAAFAERAKWTRPARDTTAAVRTDVQRGVDTDLLVTFEVAGQEFALPIDDVREIVPSPENISSLAQSEDLVVGMMVLRDQLLPLLSLRGLLGLGAAANTNGLEKVVVTRVGGNLVGLVTDRARSILSAERSRIEPIPAVLAARTQGESKITAVYRRENGGKLVSILAAGQLFREDIMQRLGTERHAQDRAGADTQKAAGAALTFLVFRLGKDEFGLPIEVVDEVATVPDKIARLPKTPKFLEGVINLRGSVLPVVDQRRRFDMPKLENPAGRRLIVVKTERHRAGIIVDSVSDILRTTADAVGATPHLTADTARLVRGVVNLESQDRIVLLLDPAELLTRAEQGLLDAFAKDTAKADASAAAP